MSVAITYPHIEKIEGNPARLARMSRIRVAQIAMDYLFQGWSPDEICNQYPHLKPAEVHSAMAYYFDHQAEIEKEIEDEARLVEEGRSSAAPSPMIRRLRAQRLSPSNES
jgi:uncharacterized protein (DUF433 family)